MIKMRKMSVGQVSSMGILPYLNQLYDTVTYWFSSQRKGNIIYFIPGKLPPPVYVVTEYE